MSGGNNDEKEFKKAKVNGLDEYANDLEIKIKELKDKGFKAKEIATIISTLFGLNKNEVYQTVINQ